MLEVTNLSCGYGQVVAVKALTFAVPRGGVVALLGPNGAGKSSTLQCIAGHVRMRSGSIVFEGEDIGRLAPEERVRRGIAVAPEGRRLFPDLSVRENLTVGGYSRPRAREAANLERVLALFPRLAERLHSKARMLSGGEQQMATIGRALMAEPRCLLIDEVSLGLMPKNINICYAAIEELKREGHSILLVEQNAKRALETADRAYVMESGLLVWQGAAEEARSDPKLADLYLGSSGDAQ
jgi:branched-chain amino acid transport system ATP-binding protein